jgi:ketosteroid isomerase-like protein
MGLSKHGSRAGAKRLGAEGSFSRTELAAGNRKAPFDTLAVTAREDITDEVFPAGDYVVEIGHYSYQGTGKAGNKPRSAAGRYMVLWRKDADGVWRIHRDIGNEAPTKKP